MEDIKIVAKQAGQAVLSFYGSDLGVEMKDDQSPVTLADKESNRIILSGLADYGYGLVSEEIEDNQDRLSQDRVWIIDPLDGTKDFIHQTGDFSILIALVERDGQSFKPILSLVYLPAQDLLYFARKGRGSFVQWGESSPLRLKVNNVKEFSRFVLIGSRFHSCELEDRLFQDLGMKERITCGSVGVKISRIASGQADLNINPSSKTWEWDVCAPELILEEAGGKLTDLEGRIFSYNKENLRNDNGYIASSGDCHNYLIKKIQEYM